MVVYIYTSKFLCPFMSLIWGIGVRSSSWSELFYLPFYLSLFTEETVGIYTNQNIWQNTYETWDKGRSYRKPCPGVLCLILKCKGCWRVYLSPLLSYEGKKNFVIEDNFEWPKKSRQRRSRRRRRTGDSVTRSFKVLTKD